jgi:hypothetical protein
MITRRGFFGALIGAVAGWRLFRRQPVVGGIDPATFTFWRNRAFWLGVDVSQSTAPFWKNQGSSRYDDLTTKQFDIAMRDAFNQCKRGDEYLT